MFLFKYFLVEIHWFASKGGEKGMEFFGQKILIRSEGNFFLKKKKKQNLKFWVGFKGAIFDNNGINQVVKAYAYKKISDGWAMICKTIGDGPEG